MSFILDISRCFFGGLEFEKMDTHWPWLIVYVILYVFYCLYFYLPKIQNKKARLIGCGALLGAILIFKLIFFFIRFLLSRGIDIDSSREEIEANEDDRPDDIPPEIWRYKQQLIETKQPIDNVIVDLIVSGVDAGGLLNLVDYLNSTNQRSNSNENINTPQESSVREVSNHNVAIQINHHIFALPFSLHQIDKILPSTPSFICILISVVFGFSSSYLLLSLTSQFSDAEKGFLSFILASSTFSIILPPSIDPYNTSINDPWNSCARPFLVTLLCTAYRLILDFLCDNSYSASDTVLTQTYGIRIEWNLFLPYIFIVIRYGLFLSLALFIGYYGHPVSTFVALVESMCRYFFGQNGVGGFLHLFVQFLRGSASVATVWGLLQIKYTGSYSKFHPTILCVCIAVSTFINLFPIMLNRYLLKHWASSFLYPLAAAAISFIFPYLCVVVNTNNYDVIKWFCFAWLGLFEIVFPYIYSANQYFCFHFLLLVHISFSPIIRYISSLIISPLFLAMSLQYTNSNLNDLVIAFIITHAVHKIHSENHVFSLAVFFTVATLPGDFGKKDILLNLFISLLVASKLEIAFPIVKMMQKNRYYQLFMDELFEFDDAPYMIKYMINLLINHMMFMVDDALKIPTLFWSVFLGGGFGPMFGIPYFLIPQPPRPNYFFDWPKSMNAYQNINKNDDGRFKSNKSPAYLLTKIFEKNIDEHPVETPVYMSAVRSIARTLGPVIKSGRLGYVNGGNIYLFKARQNAAAFFLHVISVEPTCFRFQLRGLEYKSQTLCHEGEEINLTEIIDEYSMDVGDFNEKTAFFASACDYDLRLPSLALNMYDVTTTPIENAFYGIDDRCSIACFICSFSYVVKNFINSSVSQDLARSSTSNLSLHEDTSTFNGRITLLSATLFQKFQNLPNEVSNYKPIIDSEPLFNKIFEYFVRNDSEVENPDQSMQQLSDGSEAPFTELMFNMFACIMCCIFNESGKFVYQNVPSNFNSYELTVHEWMQEWISSLSIEVTHRIISQFVRLGYALCFFASSSVFDLGSINSDVEGEENTLPDAETLRDIYEQMIDLDASNVVAPINSHYFISEFITGEKTLISIAGSKILRFTLSNTEWGVFQINQDYARGIWSQEARDILFFKNEDSERLSIQENLYFLNNLIIQACEIPVGYPAYTSEIFEAYANPFLKDNLILP